MITGNFEIVFIITYCSCCTEAHWVQFSRKKNIFIPFITALINAVMNAIKIIKL